MLLLLLMLLLLMLMIMLMLLLTMLVRGVVDLCCAQNVPCLLQKGGGQAGRPRQVYTGQIKGIGNEIVYLTFFKNWIPPSHILGICRVADPDPGWAKSQDSDPGSGSGMIIPDHISESLETIFWAKIPVLEFFDAVGDPGIFLTFGSGIGYLNVLRIVIIVRHNFVFLLAVSITINVPVVYMGRYEVVLRGDYP
jgi:hypothetical protein